jgi:hypothetical protein
MKKNIYYNNLQPQREWSRVQSIYTTTTVQYNEYSVYVPLTKQKMAPGEANFDQQILLKSQILQYKKNSSGLTKNQKYSQISKRLSSNKTKSDANYLQKCTNQNNSCFMESSTNSIIGLANNKYGSIQYGFMNHVDYSSRSLISDTLDNPSTNELIKQKNNNHSDVPKLNIVNKSTLDSGNNTLYPSQKLKMNNISNISNTSNRYPVNYNIDSQREWSRVQSFYSTTSVQYNEYSVYDTLTKQKIPPVEADFNQQILLKANILQYKKNSSNLTKKQKYSQISKGILSNKNKEIGTNNKYSSIRYELINHSDSSSTSLICNTFENHSINDSDVPGFSKPNVVKELTWDSRINTWYPRQKLKMNNSGNKSQVNYNLIIQPCNNPCNKLEKKRTIINNIITPQCDTTILCNLYDNFGQYLLKYADLYSNGKNEQLKKELTIDEYINLTKLLSKQENISSSICYQKIYELLYITLEVIYQSIINNETHIIEIQTLNNIIIQYQETCNKSVANANLSFLSTMDIAGEIRPDIQEYILEGGSISSYTSINAKLLANVV